MGENSFTESERVNYRSLASRRRCICYDSSETKCSERGNENSMTMSMRVRYIEQWCGYVAWLLRGRPDPAGGLYKRRMLLQLAKSQQAVSFVETGTGYGDLVLALAGSGCSCVSIEKDLELFNKAQRRLKGISANIRLVNGDSAQELGKLIPDMRHPILYWLDAHPLVGSTGTVPLLEELAVIGQYFEESDIIAIDDVRGFTGSGGWPVWSDVEEALRRAFGEASYEVQHDVCVVRPRTRR